MNKQSPLRSNFSVLLLFLVLTLSGCGAAKVRTDMTSADIHRYETVFVNEVDVHSQEESAQDNAELQTKMGEWEAFARAELEAFVNESHYQLLTEPPGTAESALVMSLDIDMVYGSRAKRYLIGFGAGRGSVDSVLTVTDSRTGEQKFRAVAESDLSVGAFGGSMEKVLKKNVSELVDQYPRAPDGVQ